MTLKEAITSSLIMLKQAMEEKLNAINTELAAVQPGQTFPMCTGKTWRGHEGHLRKCAPQNFSGAISVLLIALSFYFQL